MQKHIQRLFTLVLTFAIISSMATGVLATAQEHVHNWQCAWSNDAFHCMVCSDCQKEKTTTHSNNNDGICTICGHTPHEHIWQYDNGKTYDSQHELHCTQCAATTTEDHIYGNDGKCTVCGNSPPHEHQYEWDGKESNYIGIHFLVCSCGATTSESHQLFAWDGQKGNAFGHSALCGVCGFALVFEHRYDSTYFNGERCTVCGYSAQGAAVPEIKPDKITPVETKPAETVSKETIPAQTKPTETQTEETECTETQTTGTEPSEETKPTETEPEETMPKNTTKEDLQRSSSVWVWVAAIVVVAGILGTVVFFLKKK